MDDTNPYAPPEKAAGQEPDESDPVGFRPRMPPATRTLVYASIGAFVLQVILSPHGPAEFAFVPTQVLEGEIWRSVTHLFVHANLISLVLGVLPVYVFGSDIENQVGSRRYIGAFFALVVFQTLFLLAIHFARGPYFYMVVSMYPFTETLLAFYVLRWPRRYFRWPWLQVRFVGGLILFWRVMTGSIQGLVVGTVFYLACKPRGGGTYKETMAESH